MSTKIEHSDNGLTPNPLQIKMVQGSLERSQLQALLTTLFMVLNFRPFGVLLVNECARKAANQGLPLSHTVSPPRPTGHLHTRVTIVLLFSINTGRSSSEESVRLKSGS